MSDLVRSSNERIRDSLVDGPAESGKDGRPSSTGEAVPSPGKRIIRLGETQEQEEEPKEVQAQGAGQTFGQAPAHLRHTVRRPDGWTLTTDRQTGAVLEETDTQMCVHCQYHWQFKPGSGALRGYCYRCQGVLCGKEGCMLSCNPFEAVLEMKEAEYREFCRRVGIPV